MTTATATALFSEQELQQIDIAKIVPHAGAMILLDKIKAFTGNAVEAELCLRDDCIYLRDDGTVAAFVGSEIMAQAIAAIAGLSRLRTGEAPRVGFLLGTRSYIAHAPTLPLHTPLRVSAQELYREENGLAVFECQLSQYVDGEAPRVLAAAKLNVFEPPDLDAFLANAQAQE